MPEELIMRGNTASGETETLSFGGQTSDYAYRMTELSIYPSTSIGTQGAELLVSVTAAKTAEDPTNPNFDNAGLIAVSMLGVRSDVQNGQFVNHTIINTEFYITQDLILSARDTLSGGPQNVNWQCKFEKIKLTDSAQAVANYNQSTIYD